MFGLVLLAPPVWGQSEPVDGDAEVVEACAEATNGDDSETEPDPNCEEDDTPEPEPAPTAPIVPLRIIVTAERTPEEALSVPLSLTTLSETQIEDADITSLNGIADRTPNFTFYSGGANRTGQFYSVRGVSNFNAFSRDAVGFFVDDVPFDFAGFIDQDLIDIERVEVLRGPQNTLYGRSSSGGAVNIVTRRPTDEFEYGGSLRYGDNQHFDSRLYVSGPIEEGVLRFRLAGSYSDREGFVYNRFLEDDVDDGQAFTGRGQLLWTPSEDWEILFNAFVSDYREGGNPYVLTSNDDPFDVDLSFNGFNDVVTNAQSLRIEHDTPNLRLTSITAHRFSRQEAAFDQDGSILDLSINAPDFSSRVFSQEFRVQSPEDADRLQWIAGAYFETASFENNRRFLEGSDSANPGTIEADGDSTNRSLAVFGQASYDITDEFTLTGGLRYENTRAELDFVQTFTTPDGFSFPLVEVDDADVTGSELLPRFVVEYRFSPDLMAYGSITRGYRPPGTSFEPFNAESAIFDAETSWNYEVGVKSAWLDDRLIVNLAAFYSDTSNFQFPSIGSSTGSVAIGTADIRTFGAELEVLARPIEGLEIIAGLGLLDAEFTNGNETFTGAPLEGNRTPFNADLTYNIAAQYRSPGGIFGRLEVIGFGTTFFDDLNSIEQEPFALVNARVGYEAENYGIYVFANNLFDEEYVTQAFDAGAGLAGTYGAPRTVGVQFRARF